MNASLQIKHVHSSYTVYIPARSEAILDECGRLRVGDGVHPVCELPIILDYSTHNASNAQTFLEENIELIDSEQFDELFRKTPLAIFDEVLLTLEASGVYHRTYVDPHTKEG